MFYEQLKDQSHFYYGMKTGTSSTNAKIAVHIPTKSIVISFSGLDLACTYINKSSHVAIKVELKYFSFPPRV